MLTFKHLKHGFVIYDCYKCATILLNPFVLIMSIKDAKLVSS